MCANSLVKAEWRSFIDDSRDLTIYFTRWLKHCCMWLLICELHAICQISQSKLKSNICNRIESSKFTLELASQPSQPFHIRSGAFWRTHIESKHVNHNWYVDEIYFLPPFHPAAGFLFPKSTFFFSWASTLFYLQANRNIMLDIIRNVFLVFVYSLVGALERSTTHGEGLVLLRERLPFLYVTWSFNASSFSNITF